VHPVDPDQSTGTSIGTNQFRQSANHPHVDDNKTRKQVGLARMSTKHMHT